MRTCDQWRHVLRGCRHTVSERPSFGTWSTREAQEHICENLPLKSGQGASPLSQRKAQGLQAHFIPIPFPEEQVKSSDDMLMKSKRHVQKYWQRTTY